MITQEKLNNIHTLKSSEIVNGFMERVRGSFKENKKIHTQTRL